MDYEEFYMNIENKNTVIVLRTAQGKTPKTYQGTIAQDTLIVDTIKFFHRCLAEGHIKSVDELKVLGSYLYKLLFDANISSVFKEDFDKIDREDNSTSRLRVTLEFKEAASDLAILPWEYIYYPEGQRFLADNNRLILTRHVPLSDLFSKLTADQESLNILVVVSKPAWDSSEKEDGLELGTIDETKTLSTINQLKSKAVDVDILYHPTRDRLENKLRVFKPHVIHIIGHGKFEDEQGWLALEDEKDHEVADWITDDTFAYNLTQGEFPRPRLVFLDACKGAYSSSYAAFRGTALKLVRSYIPAVVAMQYEVENEVANLFADAFYRSLSQGNPIDESVQAGRLKLRKYLSEKKFFSSRAFGSPVVFLQTANGIIIAKGQDDTDKEKPAPEPSGRGSQYQCPFCGEPFFKLGTVCYECGKPIKLCPFCLEKGLKNLIKPGKFCAVCEKRDPDADKGTADVPGVQSPAPPSPFPSAAASLASSNMGATAPASPKGDTLKVGSESNGRSSLSGNLRP